MAGLFETPQDIRARESQQRAELSRTQDPLRGGLFNLGHALGGAAQRGIAGVETRSPEELNQRKIQGIVKGVDFSNTKSMFSAANALNASGNTQAAIEMLKLIPEPGTQEKIYGKPFTRNIEAVDPETGNVTSQTIMMVTDQFGNPETIGNVTSKPTPSSGAGGGVPKSFKAIGNAMVDGRQTAIFTHPARHAGAPFVITGFDKKGHPITSAKELVGKELFQTERTMDAPLLGTKFNAQTIQTELKTKFGGILGTDLFSDMGKDEINAAAIDISNMISAKMTDNVFRKSYTDNPTGAKAAVVKEWLKLNRPELAPQPLSADERRAKLDAILQRQIRR